MSRMRGIHDGDLTVDRDGEVSGIVTGDVTIAPGAAVTVSGIVEGDVRVGAGARVTVSGMVSGRIRGDTARVTVTGMVRTG